MNRRTFLHAAGGTFASAAAAACAARAATHPRLPCAQPSAMTMPTPLPMQSPARVVVYDPTLERGRALAQVAARMNVPAFALGEKTADDIGMLWQTRLARHVEVSTEAPIVALCALRASDRFVLERLALPRRCIVLAVPQT